jgi:hypothetical protein
MSAEDLFANVPSDGAKLEIDQAFERLGAKEDPTASESQPEKKETEKPAQEGDNTPEEKLPFHKHPRWIKHQQELIETREKLAKLESERAKTGEVVLPDWWKTQYGDTDESKQRYAAVVQKDGELDWIKQQVKEELRAEKEAESAHVKEGEEYVDTQVQEMTDEGLKFDRNELLKFMVDFQKEFGSGALIDTAGNYDFRKSLTLMNKMNPPAPAAANVQKVVAAIGARGKAAPPQANTVPVIPRNVLRRGSWRDIKS